MKMKSIAALSIVGLMALQMPMTAFASVNAEWCVEPGTFEHIAIDTTKPVGVYNQISDVTATVNGDVKVTNSSNDQDAAGVSNLAVGTTVKVLGDIKVEKTNTSGETDSVGVIAYGGTTEAKNITALGNDYVYGVYIAADGNPTTVIADGDITAETKTGTGNYSTTGIYVNSPTADVTVKAEKLSVTNHTTNGRANGINIYGANPITNRTIDIECDGIELTSDYKSTAITSIVIGASNTNDIRVNGDITGNISTGVGIVTLAAKNSVTIDGSVEATDIGAYFETAGGQNSLVVNGILSGNQYALQVYTGDEDCNNVSVYGLKTSETGTLSNSSTLLAKVNYIVHGSDGSADYKNMTFDPSEVSTVSVNGKTYYTAKEGTITVTVGSGYTLKSTQEINGSGNTYTVTIPQGGFVTLEAILAAVQTAEEESEQKPLTTGSVGAPVTGGRWNMGPGGVWTYTTNAKFRNTWAYIGNPYANAGQAKEGWFYFDKNGVMLTGWQTIDGKEYYFNESHDGTCGMMLSNTTTPDGKKVGADGARIQ